MKKATVHFQPIDRKVEADTGANLVDVAMDAGIHINAACGGEGACGKCRVRITSGSVDYRDGATLSQEDIEKGFRLACRCFLTGDVEVTVPREAGLYDAGVAYAREYSGRYVSSQELERLVGGAWYSPAIKKFAVKIDPPTLDDNTSDLNRLLRALKQQHNLESISIDFLLLKSLSRKLRESNWKVTTTIVQTRMESQLGEHQLRGSRRPKMITIAAGDTTRQHYAVVLDIGTTSLWGQLVDINNRRVLAESSEYNPQITFGDDVITRIIYSQKKDGLEKLQKVIVEGLNKIIDALVEESGVQRDCISQVTAAGNTVMTHLLLGLDPKYIRETPYTPVSNLTPPIRAVRIGLNVADYVYLYTFPSVASYVGGDIVSGVLSSGMCQKNDLSLYIDIGTNGEIVVGNCDWMMTASCSAGPAFEGGGLKCGMRATSGAIERFHINPDTLEPMIVTINKTTSRGICGSGAISILAEFLETGVIDQNGKFNCTCKTKRIRKGSEGMEYVLVYKEETGSPEDIVITEADIDNIIRAKAAMFAGYQCLLEKAGLSFQNIERVIIAGAFGDFIDLEKAMTIGLLPELPKERFVFIGNGSLTGAKLICLSNELLDDGERIARKMTNIELSEDYSFMDKYMAGMFLPHTDGHLFPKVIETITDKKQAC